MDELPPGPLAAEASGARIRWKRGELLGSGASARVYLGLNEDTGTLMAVKQAPFDVRAEGGVLRQLEQEIKLLSQLSHPNVVPYLGAETVVSGSEGCLYIFMELVPGGSLASLIRRFGRLNERLIRLYTRQILQGLAFLHEHGVIHRDVKGGNILVDRSGECKLSDFGASQILTGNLLASGASFVLHEGGAGEQPRSREAAAAAAAAAAASVFATQRAGLPAGAAATAGAASVGAFDPHLTLRGTPCWMAPEVIRQVGYGRKSDVWSVGCTVIEMVTGRPPWGNFDSPGAALYAIASATGPPPFPADISEECRSFLTACLQRDPSRRPTVSELLQHPFVAQAPPPRGSSDGTPRGGTPGVDSGTPEDRRGHRSSSSGGEGGGGVTRGWRSSPSPEAGNAYAAASRTINLSLSQGNTDLMGLRLHREATSITAGEPAAAGVGEAGAGKGGGGEAASSINESLPGSGPARPVNPFSRTFAELQQQQMQMLSQQALQTPPAARRGRAGSSLEATPPGVALATWKEDEGEEDDGDRAAPTLRPVVIGGGGASPARLPTLSAAAVSGGETGVGAGRTTLGAGALRATGGVANNASGSSPASSANNGDSASAKTTPPAAPPAPRPSWRCCGGRSTAAVLPSHTVPTAHATASSVEAAGGASAAAAPPPAAVPLPPPQPQQQPAPAVPRSTSLGHVRTSPVVSLASTSPAGTLSTGGATMTGSMTATSAAAGGVFQMVDLRGASRRFSAGVPMQEVSVQSNIDRDVQAILAGAGIA